MADVAQVLDVIREKRERLKQLQVEVAILAGELRQIEAAAKGRDLRKPKSRHGFTNGKRSRSIQEGSSVDRAIKALRGVGHDLPADELVDLINSDGGEPVKKPTLVSNLSRYVQHGDTFSRPSPGVYGLREFAEGDAQPMRAIDFGLIGKEEKDEEETE